MSDAAPAPQASDLKLRVISAIVMAVAVLAATWFGGWPFAIVWIGASALVATEFLTMANARSYGPMLLSLVGVMLSGLWALDMAQAAALVGSGASLGLLIAPAILCGLIAALVARGAARRWALLAAPYAAVLAIVPILARGPHLGGIGLILWLFATVWFTDIAAYFAGRAIGGPKIWPAVSPKKTWSGAIGGTIAGVIGGVAIVLIFGKPPLFSAWSIIGVAGFTLLTSIASQIGDFAESAMKRNFQVKDSSHLIPGHGGLMDRLDGFWAACLVLLATILIVEG